MAVGLGSIDGGSCATWSANQCCVRVQAIPALTVTATIVSTTILAVTTEKALTYLTTLSTMNVGACTESVSKSIFLQHYPYVQLGFTGCSFRHRRCDEYSCAVFQYPSQLHHHGSVSAVFGDNCCHAGGDLRRRNRLGRLGGLGNG